MIGGPDENVLGRDAECVWHPYTQHGVDRPFLEVVRGEGTKLFDAEGNEYLDACSSWWVTLHGHSHPYIAAELSAQLETLEHAIFAGVTHPWAVDLSERLLRVLPGGLARCFFSDDGSTAVEAALKMVIQERRRKGLPRGALLALDGGYHGDTFGAMAVSRGSTFSSPFSEFLFPVTAVPAPLPGAEEASLAALERALSSGPAAALIYEPLVQGAGGMRMYGAEALDAMLERCRRSGVRLIADEVMTGFGRTGPLFASSVVATRPDIICLSKGLTGGVLPMGLTACTEDIFSSFVSSDRADMFLHGHSFTGNPLGCRAALASLSLLLHPECEAARERIHARHVEVAPKLSGCAAYRNVRVTGTILALDVRSGEAEGYFSTAARNFCYRFALERGVLLRPLGNVLYLMPPYSATGGELSRMHGVLMDLGSTLAHSPMRGA